MRLFIAVNFDEKTKSLIVEAASRLKSKAETGNFTGSENLHVTLAFLGEREAAEVESIRQAMALLPSGRFTMTLSGIGTFSDAAVPARLFWIGIAKEPALDALFRDLKKNLEAKGISIEEKEFVPHLTIGREVVLKAGTSLEGLSAFPPIRFSPSRVSLMESLRSEGKPVYREIGKKNL